MLNITQYIYNPRPNEDVQADISYGLIPTELKELMKLAESSESEAKLKEEILKIVETLLTKSGKDTSKYTPTVHISCDPSANACCISERAVPMLVINAQLIKEATSLDELVGIIAHELGHIILHKDEHTENNKNGKPQECGADLIAVNLMVAAGYNPEGLKEFFKRHNESKSEDPQKFEKLISTLKVAIDPHPSFDLRIRSVENALAALERNANTIPKHDLSKYKVELDTNFKKHLKDIRYETPIEAGLKKFGYNEKSVEEKLLFLIELVKQNYPVYSENSCIRIAEIAIYIGNLDVDFAQVKQKEHFYELFHLIVSQRKTNQEYYSSLYHEGQLFELLYTQLQNVWNKKHPTDPELNYVATLNDLRIAFLNFTNATSKKDAEEFAKTIENYYLETPNLAEIMLSYPKFTVPSESEVQESIKLNGSWTPDYKNHVDWCENNPQSQISKVLLRIGLGADPWVRSKIGEKALRYHYSDTHYYLNDPKLKTITRSSDGVVTKITDAPKPEFYTPNKPQIGKKTTKEEITKFYLQEAKNREKFEKGLIARADWSLLKTNFKHFIYLYGRSIASSHSFDNVTYPFAEKFIQELTKILPNANADYKKQVLEFINPKITYTSDPGTLLDCTFLFDFEIFHYFTLQHPIIKFLLNEPGKTLIPDDRKKIFLAKTDGFITANPSNCKFSEQFIIPLDKVFTSHPKNIKSIDDLFIQYTKFTNISVIAEAEILCYANKEKLTLEDLTKLNIIFQCNIENEFMRSNLPNFLENLKKETLQRHFTNKHLVELINSYKYSVASRLILEFPELKEIAFTNIKALIESLPIGEKETQLSNLLKSTEYSNPHKIYYKFEKDFTYDGTIDNPEFRSWAVKEYSSAIALRLGQDNSTQEYLDKAKSVVEDIIKDTSGAIRATLLAQLAEKTVAQKELAYLIRDEINKLGMQDVLSHNNSAMLSEIALSEISGDTALREKVLDFLSSPLTDKSHEPIINYLSNKYKVHNREKIPTQYALQTYHKNFWALPLEARTLYLEKIIFPLGGNPSNEVTIIKDYINKTFPTNSASNKTNNEYAQKIITAYLNSVEHNEARLIASAIVAANMQTEGSKEITVGKKLHTILSSMGPAGGKLMQAIHSHPSTPQEIKNDLASSKTNYAQPYRWEVIEYVEKAGLFEGDNKVTHVGKVVGSGSFGVTVFDTLNNEPEKVADTFLRPNAYKLAKREFDVMKTAAEELSLKDPTLKPIKSMVDEARDSAVQETDMGLSAKQTTMAKEAYDNIQVNVDGKLFTHKIAGHISHGNNHKRVKVAHGEHFNDLEDGDNKKAIAKAMIATQLTLILRGVNTDNDRHGGNIKIEDNVISHFDFGAMNITELTKEDRKLTGQVLALAILDSISGKDFTKSLLNHIDEKANNNYLKTLKKNFLALGDYTNLIEQKELAVIFAQSLTSELIHPEIQQAFKTQLGFMGFYVCQELQKASEKSKVFLTLNNDNEQTKTAPLSMDFSSITITELCSLTISSINTFVVAPTTKYLAQTAIPTATGIASDITNLFSSHMDPRLHRWIREQGEQQKSTQQGRYD